MTVDPVIYVCADSKADLNRRIATDDTIKGRIYSVQGVTFENLRAMPTGTIVKVYRKIVGGSPVVKSVGTWNALTRRVK